MGELQVGVVAVSGRARQGKSFILNQLLGQTSGFTVGPTHRPCTKGLWMWSAPVERNSPDGSKYHLVCLLLKPESTLMGCAAALLLLQPVIVWPSAGPCCADSW